MFTDEELMTREEALALVREYVKNEGLVRHMLAVEAAMRFYAEKFTEGALSAEGADALTTEDVERWGLIGLLHDFDWEIHPTLEQHPQDGAPILREHGVPEDVIQDILSHADHLGLPRDTLVRKAISACDEITGLITAVALVRPSRSLYDLEPSSVKKKWKDKAFAAGTSRTEMEQAAREFGVDLWEHVGNVIQAMRRIAPELGLEGNLPKP
jgi:predicted hydrolase (HD superfamily)